ncbi:hypothetical protein HPB52_020817 [Rhipicephalus sanguineus]|uniref:Uncharacterized protein n=1 Tax=Rhipicephalus sanguineus TaxID=34632 RepID=A0A9D4T1N4_RHISA|nr:hypothetical protein HPB52_020817 [Rhipicephalus sanguineus]
MFKRLKEKIVEEVKQSPIRFPQFPAGQRILSESQDKALRRMGELREQAQLEQQAKAHLEENLRCQLEEKEHIIQTLETKVALLKANNAIPGAPCDTTAQDEELAHYKEKESEAEAQAKWRMEQQELEQQARQLSESLDAASAERAQLHKQLSEIKAQHQQQLAALEKSLDEERSRAKVADLGLLKQECDKKIAAAEHNWVQKLEASEKEYHRRISEKENELRRVAKKLSELKSITEESEEQEGTEDAETGHGDGLLRDIESYQLVKHNLEQSVQQLKAELTTEQERAAQVQLQLNEEVGRLQAELQKQTNTFHDLQAQLDKALQCEGLKKEVEDHRLLAEERLSEVDRLTSEAEQLRKELQTNTSLEKEIDETRHLAEEMQSEVARVTSEAQVLQKELQANLAQLEESRQKETQLVKELQLSKSQTELNQSTLLEQCRELEEEIDKTRRVAEESQSEVARLTSEAIQSRLMKRQTHQQPRMVVDGTTHGQMRDEINDLRCILRAQQNNNATNHTGKNPVQLPEPTEYERRK